MAGRKGRSGRKPKPTKMLKLQGGYRPDRHLRVEPEPEMAIPEPPKCLRGIALEEWSRITKLLAGVKCLAELDMGPLAAYCLEWGKYVNANNRLRVVRSMLTESTKGTKMAHPLLRVSDRALANMLRICEQFGMTPSARSRLDIHAAGGVEDPLANLIRRQAERRKQVKSGA
jgi:P27 family predicted phage terminase small subunit